MKKIFFMVMIAGLLFSCREAGTEKSMDHAAGMKSGDSVASCCASRDGLFIHLSSGYENPHNVLMALNMASMMSMDEDVIIYADIKGVELLLKDSKDLTYKTFPSLFTLLDQLAENKVTVMACPGCLEAAGFKVEDLRPGVIVADKKKFWNFTKGKIITLNY